jgi:hypothetical protein
MRGRLPLVPIVLTAVCAAGIVGAATAASGAPAPVPVAQQGGHWVVSSAASAALHVHGGTAQVDARVDLPPDATRDGSTALAGGSEGFVVGRDRVWTFDRSTLTVVADAGSAAAEVPVPVEVVGGPYLVYRQAGTVVRLGAPAVVLDAGGPLGSPVRTPDGTVAVHRLDTGAVCGLHRDAQELDCGISTRPGSRGGLTAVGGTVVFVDTGSDAAYRVLFGAGLDGGTRLGTDLPDDALLGDRAVGDRLPVVLPGSNVLRLVDVGGLAALRPGAAPVDIPLGEGAFSAPVVGESAIALLELTSGRLITFAPDGARMGEVELPPGSTADDLVRGEDGRIYLDEPGRGRVHVVQPGGSVDTVEIGTGRGAAVAVAPPPEQLAPVRPPLPGQVVVPPDVLARPVGAPGGGAVVAVPGGPGNLPLPAVGDDPVPDPQPPPVGAPPAADPAAPPPEVVEPPVAEVPPAAPTQLTAWRVAASRTIEVDWEPPAGPVDRYFYLIQAPVTIGLDVFDSEYSEPDNYCSPDVTIEVSALGVNRLEGPPATLTVSTTDPIPGCTPTTEVLSADATPDGVVTAVVRCTVDGNTNYEGTRLELVLDGDVVDEQPCEADKVYTDSEQTFVRSGLASGSTHTLRSRVSGPAGDGESDPVTVTVP